MLALAGMAASDAMAAGGAGGAQSQSNLSAGRGGVGGATVPGTGKGANGGQGGAGGAVRGSGGVAGQQINAAGVATGSTPVGANGTDGGASSTANTSSGNGGGGGGGGGGAGVVSAIETTTVIDYTAQGGDGGNGGDADISKGKGGNGGGGGGGEGGSGFIAAGKDVGQTITIEAGGAAFGGFGGDGGDAKYGSGGNGGDGGFGVQVIGVGRTVVNDGAIGGGNGGDGGVRSGVYNGIDGNGVAGVGGVGIVGADLTIINSGTISGGFGGADNKTQSEAILFTGGTNTLELHGTSDIQGNVVANGALDTLVLGGETAGEFDMENLVNGGYQGFEAYEKTGGSTWIVTGDIDGAPTGYIRAGTLQVGDGISETYLYARDGETTKTIAEAVTGNGTGAIGGDGVTALVVEDGTLFVAGNSEVGGGYGGNGGESFVDTGINPTGTATGGTGGNGGNGVALTAGKLLNEGYIYGGDGGYGGDAYLVASENPPAPPAPPIAAPIAAPLAPTLVPSDLPYTLVGGDGGNGGAGVVTVSAELLVNDGNIEGGWGGDGRSLDSAYLSQNAALQGGNGGIGGVGVAFLTSGAQLSNNDDIEGGRGGDSGYASAYAEGQSTAVAAAGTGGTGGVGVVFAGAGSLANSGDIEGGRGGDAGAVRAYGGGEYSGEPAGAFATGGAAGDGGVGVYFAGVADIANSGSIEGGRGGRTSDDSEEGDTNRAYASSPYGTSVLATGNAGGNGNTGIVLAAGGKISNTPDAYIEGGEGREGSNASAESATGAFGNATVVESQGGLGGNGGNAVVIAQGALADDAVVNGGSILGGDGGNGGSAEARVEIYDNSNDFGRITPLELIQPASIQATAVAGTGGAGGVGLTFEGAGTLSNAGDIQGGQGGDAGTARTTVGENINSLQNPQPSNAVATGAAGGDGGTGVYFGGVAKVSNSGLIAGGDGGSSIESYNDFAPSAVGPLEVSNSFNLAGAGSTGGATATASGNAGGNGGTGLVMAAGGEFVNTEDAEVIGGNGGSGSSAIAVAFTDTSVQGATPSATATGGNGGRGGDAIVVNNGTLANQGYISGGAGGSGGSAQAQTYDYDPNNLPPETEPVPGQGIATKGAGGDGGNGIVATSTTLTNAISGEIRGGDGGMSGSVLEGPIFGIAGEPGPDESVGAGGIAITGSDLTIVNAGTIAGGWSGDYAVQANAIAFTGGVNSLTIEASSDIAGKVDAFTRADTFALGGKTDARFDVADIGDPGSDAQYRGFGIFRKVDDSTWALDGATKTVTPWTIDQGTLSIASDASLGDTSGDLTFNGGTLRTTADTASARSIVLVSPLGTISTDAKTTLTVNGTVSGAGTLVKEGAGTLALTAANSYAGGTRIDNGTIATATTGALSTGPVAVNTNGTLLLGGNFDAADLAIAIAPRSSNDSDVGGAFVQFADNSSAGNATIANQGWLEFKDDATAGNAQVRNSAGARSVFRENSTAGTATLVNAGGGLVDFWDETSADAATVVNGAGGTVRIDRLEAEGIAIGSLEGAGRVLLGEKALTTGGLGTSTTISGVISGDGGSLIKTGAGTLTLTGANTYNNGTTVSDGVLQLGDGGTTGSIRGDVVDNATLAFNRSDATTFAGAISGTGAVQQIGAGTTTLTADNTYTGGTTISGGALRLGNGGTTGSIQGDVVNDSGLVFNRSDATTFAGAVSGTGTVQQAGAGTTTLTGASTYTGGTTISAGTLQLGDGGTTGSIEGDVVDNGALIFNRSDATTFAGAVSGTGSVRQAGTGTTALTGASTYTGGTTISAGTLQLGDGGTTGSIQGNVVDNGALVFNRSDATTFAGAISGTGTVRQIGAGTTTLAAASSYTGGTRIDNGAIATSTNGALGTGPVAIDTTGSLLLGGSFDAASLAVANKGTFELRDNATAGGATVKNEAGGTVRIDRLAAAGTSIGSLEGAGAVALGSKSLTTGGLGTSTTVSGPISGDGGSLAKTGAGTLTLTGANSYTGGTTISGGTLQLGDGGTTGSIRGNVANSGALVFNRSDSTTFAGVVSGTGSVRQAGTGSTRLAAVNSYTGGTNISAGTLIGGASSFGSGAIVNNAALIVDQSTDATLANDLSGTGSLTKSGNATVFYTGNGSGFTGALQVAGGALSVAGSLNATVTVEPGTVLKGNGSVGSTFVANGATVAPGNSIGTLTFNGDLTFAPGAFYQVETNASGQSDLIRVTGTANLGGASVVAIAADGNWGTTTSYTILTAGTRSGTFGGVSSNFAFLDPTLSYVANDVLLTLRRNDVAFPALGLTPNQRTSGARLEALASGALFDAVVQLDAPTARSAFDQLSGEMHASLRSSIVEDSRFIREAGIDRIRQTQGGVNMATDLKTVEGMDGGAWGRVYGSWGSTDSDGNAAKVDRDTSGVIVGADRRVGDWRVGVMGGAGRSDVDVDARNSSAKIDDYHFGIYGGTEWGALALRTGATYSHHKIKAYRDVAFTGLADSLASDYDARTAQVFGELGWRLDAGGAVALEPFANLAYVDLKTDSFGETGGIAALGSRSQSSNTTFTTLGLRANTKLDAGPTGTTLRGMVGWRHAFGDVSQQANLAYGNGNAFTVSGVPIAKDAAVIEAGLDFAVRKDLTLGVSYSGQMGDGVKDHGVRANLLWKF